MRAFDAIREQKNVSSEAWPLGYRPATAPSSRPRPRTERSSCAVCAVRMVRVGTGSLDPPDPTGEFLSRRRLPSGRSTHPRARPGEARACRPDRWSETTCKCARTVCPLRGRRRRAGQANRRMPPHSRMLEDITDIPERFANGRVGEVAPAWSRQLEAPESQTTGLGNSAMSSTGGRQWPASQAGEGRGQNFIRSSPGDNLSVKASQQTHRQPAFVSSRTVHIHLAHVETKPGLTSRVQLVQEAAQQTLPRRRWSTICG